MDARAVMNEAQGGEETLGENLTIDVVEII